MAGDVCWVGLDDRALLRVEGPDARDLLQGLVSNDLGRLAPGRALYAALLTPQGKYLFDFVLLDDGRGAVLVDVERARAAELRQRLLMYRLRAKTAIEDAPADLAVAVVFGQEAAERLGLPAETGSARAGGEADGATVAAVDPRLADLGCRAVLPRAGLAAFASRHGLRPATAEDYDLHRLRLGVPDGSRDLVPQRSTLLESGFEELRGVSFEKGCFVGQELTARMKYRGLVKKRLFPVRAEGPLPAPGTSVLVSGGEAPEAGEMRSGLRDRGLALLRLEPALASARGGQELRAGETRLFAEVPTGRRLSVLAGGIV